ncbi:9643_t:CDS:2 [Entrophospora sp. SA101]|nr:1248_t:CDS:2 [Entrophospora sp. SA101]CAJ0847191.1 9643_t:CDS:2 [Entrophospora sp. SA101]CAJ0911369.1 5366_t:CDS:2 [Entrophospora sp. SA101]
MSLSNDLKELKDLKLKMDRNARRRERRRLRKFQKTKKPRPPNSFILYRTYMQNTIINKSNKSPTNMRVASKKISELWKHEPNAIKTFWYQLAVKEKSRTSDKTVSEIVSSLNLPMCKVTSFAHLSTATTSNLDEETYEPQITFIINENNIITQQSFQKSFQTVTPTSCNSNKNNNGDANYHHNAYHENVYLLSMNDMTSPPSISHPHGSFDNKNVLRDPCLVETFYDTAKYHIDDKSKDANFNTSPLIEFTTCEQEPLAPLFDLLDNNNENIQ